MLLFKVPTKVHVRPDLWYGKYHYSLRIKLPEAHCLRSYEDKKISQTLAARRRWGRRMMDTQGLFAHSPGSWRWQELEIGPEVEHNIYALRDFLVSQPQPLHKIIAGDWIYFYTNNPELLDRLENLPFLDRSVMLRSEIKQQGNPGTVQLKNPKHKYRTYLRSMKITPESVDSLVSWLSSQCDIKISTSLKNWISWKSSWLDHYYFFDHDSESIVTMLNMLYPGITRKTIPIEKAK